MGRCVVGCAGLEGIPRRQPPSQDVSRPDVSFLSPCHSPRFSGHCCVAVARGSANLTTTNMRASPNGQIRGVLFDWDGTLLNSYHPDSSAYLAMFREMGIPWTLADPPRPYSPNCSPLHPPPHPPHPPATAP